MIARRVERSAWLIGSAGLVASAIGWWVSPSQFPHAWLAALTCWLGWPLGSMALLLIHALTGGRWGLIIRRQLASGIATLPLLLPAMIPLLVVQKALYPWMRPEVAARLDNRFYLNEPFFYVRSLIYLTVWLGVALAVLRALREENPEPILYRLAPPALIGLMLTVTFAAFDYTLSLEPHFKSSIYGMLAASESVLLALSVAVLGASVAHLSHAKAAVRDLGRLLFALLLLWAYLDFMQILIVWNSNLPDEANWYLHRLMGGWSIVAVAIVALHFMLPFFALIWPQVQRSWPALGAIAALLVGTEVARAWWLVIPAAARQLSCWDVTAMMAVPGLGAAIALKAFRSPWLLARLSAYD